MNEQLSASRRLDIIRHKGRPTALDYIPMIFTATGFAAMTGL